MPAEPPVAVVTGASDSIGRVIALHLADIGYFADDWDDPDLWLPPALVSGLIGHIGAGALDQFSGQYIHAAADDWLHMGDD
jgi:NAD(P)-dependent dehydrogenase (short-subunit alcohol dehydrogenase family)